MVLTLCITFTFSGTFPISGPRVAEAALPPPLSTLPILEANPFVPGAKKVKDPVNIGDFVVPTANGKKAAIVLGKALFWDQQIGSDGQSCASCHFHAGADSRSRNQVTPGLLAGDTIFHVKLPNQQLLRNDFPFHQRVAPRDRQRSAVLRDTNDVVSSMGVFLTKFLNVLFGLGAARDDVGTEDTAPPIFPDQVFNDQRVLDQPFVNPGNAQDTRRVEPRNTPTAINAALLFSNFWDGRARNIFNGVNPFGELDVDAAVFASGKRVNVTNGVLENFGGTNLNSTPVRIPDASLASQAVGPPLSDFEMSFQGRTFAQLGAKMVRPGAGPGGQARQVLAFQVIDPNDSVLGTAALAGAGLDAKPASAVIPGAPGLVKASDGATPVTYNDLIEAAFQPWWWNSTAVITFQIEDYYFHFPEQTDPRGYYWQNGEFIIDQTGATPLTTNFSIEPQTVTQREANFSLFFGLAVQLYEATLIADDTPVDRFLANGTPLPSFAAQAAGFGGGGDPRDGMTTFFGAGKCFECHRGPEFAGHTITAIRAPANAPERNIGVTVFGQLATTFPWLPANAIEFMGMARGGRALYDGGFYNISFRPTEEDICRAANSPFANPLTPGQPLPLSFSRLAQLKVQGLLPTVDVANNKFGVAEFVPDLPFLPRVRPFFANFRLATRGSHKTPGLRNQELLAPYMHSGGASTLRQVVEFYTRGGNFPATNIADLDPFIREIGRLRNRPDRQNNLVAFMLCLTDYRVKFEKEPFDHPQLLVPPGDGTKALDGTITGDVFVELAPAVGRGGRPAAGLPPLYEVGFLDEPGNRLSPFDPGNTTTSNFP